MEGQLCKRGNLMKWKWPINMKVIRSTHHQGMRGKAYWHVDTWQKPTQCCEAVILQLKINRLKSTTRDVPGDPVTKAVLPTSGIRGMGLKSHMLRGEAKKKKINFCHMMKYYHNEDWCFSPTGDKMNTYYKCRAVQNNPETRVHTTVLLTDTVVLWWDKVG